MAHWLITFLVLGNLLCNAIGQLLPLPPDCSPVPPKTTPKDTPTTVTLSCTDQNGDSLSFVVIKTDTKEGGTLSFNNLPLAVTYTPPLNYLGTDFFTVVVTNGPGAVFLDITVDVTPVNAAPVCSGTASFTTNEDTALSQDNATWLQSKCSDVDVGDTLSIAEIGDTAPSKGTFTYDNTASQWVYTPTLNANGVDTFTVTVQDSAGTPATATLTIQMTITPGGCPSTSMYCPSSRRCVMPLGDHENCGRCGNNCRLTDRACKGGVCVKPPRKLPTLPSKPAGPPPRQAAVMDPGASQSPITTEAAGPNSWVWIPLALGVVLVVGLGGGYACWRRAHPLEPTFQVAVSKEDPSFSAPLPTPANPDIDAGKSTDLESFLKSEQCHPCLP